MTLGGRRPVLVLVVEDDARAAQRLATMLREDGWDAEVACDGAMAIARLTRSPLPTILVTDMRLPHADGVAVSKYARSRKPTMPIFVVTGHPQLAASLGEELIPPPVVFTKPLVYDDLSAALKAVRVDAGSS